MRTDLLINGTPISLAAGIEVKQPLTFWLDHGGALRPNRKEHLSLHVFSNLEKPAEATVRVSAARP